MLIRDVFALFCFLVLGCCATAQSPHETLPFLKPGIAARSAGEDLLINPQVTGALKESTGSIRLAGVPFANGGSGDFELKPVKIFAESAQIVHREEDGTTWSVGNPSAVPAWTGSDPRRPGTSMFISVDKDSRLFAMVLGDERTSITTIVPHSATRDSYQIAAGKMPQIPVCAGAREVPSAYSVPLTRDAGTRGVAPGQVGDIELALDITSDLMMGWGGDVDTMITYIVNLVGPVNMIYRRDLQVDFHIVQVMTHETNPFAVDFDGDNDIDTDDQLNAYRTYVKNSTSAVADLYHLLDAQQNLGGIAYVNVLSGGDHSYRTGVSNVRGVVSGIPAGENVFAWDTYVVAHELGHNVGSPHTHCYRPPIDCCQTQCVGCTQVVAQQSTIMSYCHLASGGSITMNFHPRVIAEVRPKIEASPLVTPHQSAPELIIRGVGDQVIGRNAPERSNTLKAKQLNGPPVDQVFIMQNIGDEPMRITRVVAFGDPQISVIAQPTNGIVAPGERVPVTLRYVPNVPGPVTSNILITTDHEDYEFVVAGRIVMPSEPVVKTVSGPIPINEGTGYWTRIPVYVENVPGWVSDVQVRFNGDNCTVAGETGLRHPRVNELYMALQSPEETIVYLMQNPGGNAIGGAGANLCNTLFTDTAARAFASITRQEAPFTGSYRPMQPFSNFNGERPNGVWTLMVYDTSTRYTGQVISVSVIIRGEVGATVQDWAVY